MRTTTIIVPLLVFFIVANFAIGLKISQTSPNVRSSSRSDRKIDWSTFRGKYFDSDHARGFLDAIKSKKRNFDVKVSKGEDRASWKNLAPEEMMKKAVMNVTAKYAFHEDVKFIDIDQDIKLDPNVSSPNWRCTYCSYLNRCRSDP